MFNTTHHQQTFRSTPNRVKPVSAARIQELLEIERAKFTKQAPESGAENLRASKVTPLGVASSFQHWDPYPISIVAAKGAWLKDVDGREMLDLSMGFGALLVGHLNEEVVKEAHATLDVGTLFATPSPITRDGAEIICRRFGLDMVRFANSGTEATMYALRTARAATGKLGVIKIEGGYHGSFDPLMVSAKPALDTAGPQGAAQRLGVKPDLIALAKSIGGGIPVAAFGGKREYMDVVVKGQHSHLGTFNGHYLAMAGIRAVDRLNFAGTWPERNRHHCWRLLRVRPSFARLSAEVMF